MNFLKIKLLVIAVIMFAASSAFASLSYDVSVDTSSLNGKDGYLYFNFMANNDAVASTATVSGFTGGTLAANNTTEGVVDGSAVNGMLPGTVVFGNTSLSGSNDYNHGITFGNSFSFSLLFASDSFAAKSLGTSAFSLALSSDAAGSTPLLGGTLFNITLNNDGTSSVDSAIAQEATVSPTPIPAAVYLLGSGLLGLVGIRRKKA